MKFLPLIPIALILASCHADDSEAMISIQNAINDSIPSPSQNTDSVGDSSTGINLSLEDFNMEEDTVDVGYP